MQFKADDHRTSLPVPGADVDRGKDLDLHVFLRSKYPMFFRLALVRADWSVPTVVNRFIEQLCKCILV